MIRNWVSLVRSGSRRIDDIYLDVIHIYAVFLQTPIHQGHVTEDCVSGPGVEFVCCHTDNVPVRRIRDVVFHEIGVIVGAALSGHLQVDAARRVAHSDSRLNTKLVSRLLHGTQIHVIGNLAFN